MAGAFQGRPGTHTGVSALCSTSGQALHGVVQWQPASTSVRGGRGLPAGQPGGSGGPLQGPGAGRQHSKVSRLGRAFWPTGAKLLKLSAVVLESNAVSMWPPFCFGSSKRRRADSISKSASAKTGQSKGRTHDPERKRKR